MSELDRNKVFNPVVVKLALVSFFADVASEMLYPITPIFLTTVLGASMTSVGFVEGVAEATASLLKTYSGVWSDRISQRKPFVVIGYLLAAIAKPVTGFANAWTTVLLARALDRTGKGIRTAPRDALLADSVDASVRGAAFGWHRGADTLGAAVGPLLAILYLAHRAGDLRSIYYWSIIPGLLSVIIALTLHEAKRVPTKSPVKSFKFSLQGFSQPFRLYVVGWTLFALTNSSDVFLLMKAKKSGMSLSLVILLYCFYNVWYAMLSPYFGGLSDRRGRKNILLFGLVVFSVTYLGFAFATTDWQFWLLFAVYGVFMAMTEGTGKALAIDLVDNKSRATGVGVLGTFTGFATIIASSVAGFLWDSQGPQWAFIYGVIGALLAFMVIANVKITRSA